MLWVVISFIHYLVVDQCLFHTFCYCTLLMSPKTICFSLRITLGDNGLYTKLRRDKRS